jgi:hypothetical protein
MWRFKDAESLQHLYSAHSKKKSSQQGAAFTYTLYCTTHHEKVHSSEQHLPYTSNGTTHHVYFEIKTYIEWVYST